MQDVTISEARGQLGELADQVRYSGEPIMLTKNGKAAVALVPPYVVEKWKSMRDADFQVLDDIWTLNPELDMTEDEIMAWAVGAVHAARREMAAERTAADAQKPTGTEQDS